MCLFLNNQNKEMMNMALKRLDEVPKEQIGKVFVDEHNGAFVTIDGKFYSVRLIEGSSVQYYDDEKPVNGDNLKEVDLPNIIEYFFGY